MCTHYTKGGLKLNVFLATTTIKLFLNSIINKFNIINKSI